MIRGLLIFLGFLCFVVLCYTYYEFDLATKQNEKAVSEILEVHDNLRKQISLAETIVKERVNVSVDEFLERGKEEEVGDESVFVDLKKEEKILNNEIFKISRPIAILGGAYFQEDSQSKKVSFGMVNHLMNYTEKNEVFINGKEYLYDLFGEYKIPKSDSIEIVVKRIVANLEEVKLDTTVYQRIFRVSKG